MEQEVRYDDRHAEVLEMLRSDLVGELEAINQYERHARMSAHPPARQLFHEIANDERHHVAELLKMIAELDPRQAQELRRVFY